MKNLVTPIATREIAPKELLKSKYYSNERWGNSSILLKLISIVGIESETSRFPLWLDLDKHKDVILEAPRRGEVAQARTGWVLSSPTERPATGLPPLALHSPASGPHLLRPWARALRRVRQGTAP